MKHKKRRWALWLIPFVLAGSAVGWYFLKDRKAQAASAVVQQRTASVVRGVLDVTLSGSGSVYPSVTADIKVETDGIVQENFMQERKLVKAGEILLTLKQEDTAMTEKKLRNTLEQRQLTYRKLVEQYEAFNITAPTGGEITELLVDVGDEIKSGAALMTVTDTSALTAEVSFENTSAEAIGSEQVLLHLPDYMTTLPAVIRSVQQDGSNAVVTVQADNTGTLKPGINIWCEAQGPEGTLASTAGVLQWGSTETISAKIAGTVQSLSAGKGDIVTEGMVLVVLYDDEAEINLENARLQVEEAQYNLDQLKVDPGKYKVIAPIDGYLTSVSELRPGDSVKSGMTIASTVNMDEMEFTVSIDELDVNKVSAGQDVIITAEAIEETKTDPMMGKVAEIALEGKVSNGVATYPVTITVPGREGLKTGMNVDAVIQVDRRENVLLVPLEALQKVGDSYMVWVKTGEAGQSNTGGEMMPGFSGFPGMTDEQREELRQQMQNMTDEERQAMRQRAGNISGGGSWQGNEPARQGEESPSQGRAAFPQGENATQGRTAFPQGEENATQGRATFPQGDNTTQGRATFPQGDESSAQGRTAFPQSSRVSTVSGSDYYAGATLIAVKTGLYNENYMEITEGLKEGDVVILPRQTSNSSASPQIMGGFSMPGGVMPGGLGGGGFTGGSFIGGGGRR